MSDPGSKDRPTPHPLDTPQEARQLDRYYVIGLVCMLALIVAFPVYKLGEPDRRQKTDQAMREQNVALGADLFAQHCMSCHGVAARGGRGFPTLGAKEFLTSVSDKQLQWLIAGGLPGSVMTAYDMDLGGPFTMQEIARLVAYLRSMEDGAPSVKGWHEGELAPAQMRRVRTESDGSHDDDDDDKHRSDDKDERETGSIAQAESGPVGVNRELQQLFTSRCATCHGAVGEGTPIAGRIRPLSPALAANPDSASDIISRGVAGTAMTAFAKTHGGQLDETRIRALVEWLRQTP